MSETEEPPPKVSKDDQLNEASEFPDTTNMSELGDDSNIMGTTDPDLDEPTEEPGNFLEGPDLPGLSVEGFAMQDGSQDSMTEALSMPEGDTQTTMQEDERKETVLDTMEMAEERLHESFEETGSQEGQEEWLSEGILTDDDFNPTAAEQSDSQNSQMDVNHDAMATQEDVRPEEKQGNTPLTAQEIVAESQQNIEDALNTLEGGPVKGVDLPDTLDAFLIRKSDVKTETEAKSEDIKEEEDDGNDTDDLLRMLSEDNNKTKKKLTKTVKDIRNGVKTEVASSDDDDFVYEGAMAKKVKMAKSLASKQPMKAKPEDTDEGDANSDDASTLKKMFVKNNSSTKSKSTLRSVRPPSFNKNTAKVAEKSKKDQVTSSTPLRPRSLLKPTTAPPAGTALTRLRHIAPPPKQLEVKKEIRTYSRVKKPPTVTKPPVSSPNVVKSVVKPKEEVKNEDSEDQEFNMDETELESDMEDERQRIMRPERMDEEAPSDEESHSEDGSLYDELPSSDSEDLDDWFQLDIRAEKAGDYLPLLGSKAKQLLLEERSRVSARLNNLKQSLCALTDSGKQQAEQVRAATMTLAELDDMLKAS